MDFSSIYLFSDIDGTLGVAGQGIPARNYEAIRRFVRQGGHFGLCTGRWVTDILHFVKGLPINSLSLINNGAAVYDFARRRCLRSITLPEEALRYAGEIAALDDRVQVIGVVESGYYDLTPERSGRAREVIRQRMPAESLRDFKGPYLKFLFLPPADRGQEILDRAGRMGHQGVYYTWSGSTFEMIPSGVSNGTGLLSLCANEGIPVSRTVFIGDNYNDKEMFMSAGLSACVAETPRELAKLCALQVGPCMDGAVADLIEWLEANPEVCRTGFSREAAIAGG